MLYQATSELGVEVICQAGLDASKAWLKRARHALACLGQAWRSYQTTARSCAAQVSTYGLSGYLGSQLAWDASRGSGG